MCSSRPTAHSSRCDAVPGCLVSFCACPAVRSIVTGSTQLLSWPATPLPAADGGVSAVAERAHHGRVGSRQDGDDQGGCSGVHELGHSFATAACLTWYGRWCIVTHCGCLPRGADRDALPRPAGWRHRHGGGPPPHAWLAMPQHRCCCCYQPSSCISGMSWWSAVLRLRPSVAPAGPRAGDQPHPGGLWQCQDHPQQQQQPLWQAHWCACGCWEHGSLC